jgi:hypothetical protein
VVWQDVVVAAGRIAGRKARRHGQAFTQHVVPAIVKPARTLWNQLIGLVFMMFAVPFGFKTVHYAMAGDRFRLLMAGSCTLMMAWFGLHSFLRARRISRS